MPKHATDDDLVEGFEARVQHTMDIALCAAAEAKGADLDDEEVEEILEWVSWHVLALLHGLDPHAWAETMLAEARGSYTIH